ncbi:uncharacterized protein ASCRUDRAFT_79611 [Ascoidea rubescens DSM 1968]|uniref:Uncharacterized protein n=1 Tax=Ascoidea rubescens DSM 1968 TaxID=1344418 RepID=A0A1D2VN77_9ASCO|nr:hypothetical protein ASCRUDRAFT_79611 [Ascoidea rubescens DSM 1968]ODV63027.1 hypothetical protein ASCRUDRAFT_79611 [Ascoidea rubescens DSM 1968]
MSYSRFNELSMNEIDEVLSESKSLKSIPEEDSEFDLHQYSGNSSCKSSASTIDCKTNLRLSLSQFKTKNDLPAHNLSKSSSISSVTSNNYGLQKTKTMACLGKTETCDSLRRNGLNLNRKPVSDVVAPTSQSPNKSLFPEEYTIETETGLVKASTLYRLNRSKTFPSNTRKTKSNSTHKTKSHFFSKFFH